MEKNTYGFVFLIIIFTLALIIFSIYNVSNYDTVLKDDNEMAYGDSVSNLNAIRVLNLILCGVAGIMFTWYLLSLFVKEQKIDNIDTSKGGVSITTPLVISIIAFGGVIGFTLGAAYVDNDVGFWFLVAFDIIFSMVFLYYFLKVVYNKFIVGNTGWKSRRYILLLSLFFLAVVIGLTIAIGFVEEKVGLWLLVVMDVIFVTLLLFTVFMFAYTPQETKSYTKINLDVVKNNIRKDIQITLTNNPKDLNKFGKDEVVNIAKTFTDRGVSIKEAMEKSKNIVSIVVDKDISISPEIKRQISKNIYETNYPLLERLYTANGIFSSKDVIKVKIEDVIEK